MAPLMRVCCLALAAAATVTCRPSAEAPPVLHAPARPATVEIASPDSALTFARVGSARGPRVIAVTRYREGTVTGVDLAARLGHEVSDPITLLRRVGSDAVRDLVVSAPPNATLRVPSRELVLPVDLRDGHVAAGTNYPEHAGEADVEDGPFLFAKLVTPTGPAAPVSMGDALLDYEVELAWVTLEPLARGATPAAMGLILCNDYTDRATLLRHVDVWNPASGTGFSTGKSFPGYLPVGDLFVVPRDFRAFAASLELRLWVNGALRQHARVDQHVWNVDEILAQTWARRDTTWEHRGHQVALPGASGTIPERTLIMAGTPGGTVFHGIGLGTRLTGMGRWLFGGWSMPVTRQVIEAYVDDARAARHYLQPGDRVLIHVERLGVIENEIVA
jgi:2-keto-4-pentenoate hydratase/2-oxohepta-3-ene-1,7-dioic acid hydratase in catechol pathway